MDRRQFVIGSTAAATALAAPHVARAQGNTIRIIYPYAPGGPGDVAVRLVADKMQASLNQSVVIENRTGGASGCRPLPCTRFVRDRTFGVPGR